MPRMIELMRSASVPANIMRSASKGALALPATEMLEILVYLSAHPIFGETARMTLAGWDESACAAACADPTTPFEVVEYFLARENRRPRLIPALLENSAVPESELLQLTQEHSGEMLRILLASPRVRRSPSLLHALASNAALVPAQQEDIRQCLVALGEAAPESVPATGEDDPDVEKFIADHAQEIAAEGEKAFELVKDPNEGTFDAGAADRAAAKQAEDDKIAADKASAEKAAADKEAEDRMSPLQKISKMRVGERIKLAMKGNKEDRFILIRDGAKLVSSAVLESSKLTDQEVEMFASMKNVQESVLRGIAGKRKFMKQYSVIRALVNNPRCPLDVQLTIAKNLLPNDLKALSMNKNVSETVRKLALKMYKDKTEKKPGLG